MRVAVIAVAIMAVALVACGSTAAPRATKEPPPRAKEPEPAAVCHRLDELRGEHCGFFTDLAIDDCVPMFTFAQQHAPNSKRIATLQLGRCVMASPICQEVEQCVAKIELFRGRPAAPTADVVCEHMHGELAHCGFDEGGKDRASCVASLAQDPDMLEKFGHCYVDAGDDCKLVAPCVQDSVFDPKDLRACDEPGEVGVGFRPAEWARRKGVGVTRLSAAHTTKDAPVETCGFRAENEWLFAATCNDGSHPIRTRSQAESARTATSAHSGRCGSIIDHYSVHCPETTYEIDIDAYVCPFAE